MWVARRLDAHSGHMHAPPLGVSRRHKRAPQLALAVNSSECPAGTNQNPDLMRVQALPPGLRAQGAPATLRLVWRRGLHGACISPQRALSPVTFDMQLNTVFTRVCKSRTLKELSQDATTMRPHALR